MPTTETREISAGILWHFTSEDNAYRGAASITPPRHCQVVRITDHRSTSWFALTGDKLYQRPQGRGRRAQRVEVLYSGNSASLRAAYPPSKPA